MFRHDIRIYIIERDIYARHAIASYLSWDRRTRVVGQSNAPHELLSELRNTPALTRLDVLMLDTDVAANAQGLAALIKLLLHHLPDVAIICLANEIDRDLAAAAARAGARGYLVREQVGIGVASAVHYVLRNDFTITRGYAELLEDLRDQAPRRAAVLLPERRNYPRLTQRIEEALWLCVIEGLPADRAAQEMGVSTSTVRSYIKEGYRILEAADDTIYPPGISPAERAFLRYSALELPEHVEEPWVPAA